jgi:probable phosphoglycerate mutase
VATTIVLVRHGETDWNRERRFQGHADVPLNAVGLAQARELAASLDGERFSAVYSSPLRRALETAEIVAARLGVAIEANAGLMEVDVGSWSGLTTLEVEERFPEGFRRWREHGSGWTDGETYEELARRVTSALAEIGRRHPGEHVLAVSHGGPIRSALASAAGLSVDSARSEIRFVENCKAVSIAVRNGKIEAVD